MVGVVRAGVSVRAAKSLHPVYSGVTLECQALRAEAVKELEELAEAVKGLRNLFRA